MLVAYTLAACGSILAFLCEGHIVWLFLKSRHLTLNMRFMFNVFLPTHVIVYQIPMLLAKAHELLPTD